MAGITPEGFVAKTLEDIKSEVEDDQRATISKTINTSSASVLGQNTGIFASKLREAWELAQAIYNAAFTDSATGLALTLRAAMTGTAREGATATRVPATVNVDPGTYPAGTLIASVVNAPNDRFTNVADVVNAGPAAANVAAIFLCARTGPVRANAGTLTVRAQAVTGWNSVTNALDGALGALEEGDTSLRLRREVELRAQGSTNVDAIRADIERDIEGVLSCTVLENDTNATDGNGVPAHSLEAIVYGPISPTADDDQAVAETVWASKAGGIGTAGNTTRSVVDAQGVSHAVRFTRPTTLPVYVQVEVEVDADTYAGDSAIAEALATVVDALAVGEPLDWRRIVGIPYAVSGVRRVTSFGIDDSPGGPFLEQDIDPGIRAIVTLETSNVTVTVA